MYHADVFTYMCYNYFIVTRVCAQIIANVTQMNDPVFLTLLVDFYAFFACWTLSIIDPMKTGFGK